MEEDEPIPGPSGRDRSYQRRPYSRGGNSWREGPRSHSQIRNTDHQPRHIGPRQERHHPQNANQRGSRQPYGGFGDARRNQSPGNQFQVPVSHGPGRGRPHSHQRSFGGFGDPRHSQSPANEFQAPERHGSDRGRTDSRQRGRQHYDSGTRRIGFKTIEEIARSDIKDIIITISRRKETLLKFLQEDVQRPDLFVLIMEILSKVSQSPFIELKCHLMLQVCNSNIINSLRGYLMDLPYAENKSSNHLYWNNQLEFWKNYIIFCESIITTSPSTALRKCRSLIENVPKACLDGLSQRHDFTLPEEYVTKLNEIREKLTTYENEPSMKRSKQTGDEQPPEDFRELSVVPTRDDLLETRPFLRPNIVDGGYKDVEHYLDVQFRLLREDCFGPVRDGINQYVADPHKRKYDNIRVFRNVTFVEPYIAQTRVGSLVQIDMTSNRNFGRINWAHNKRFLFGSLVLFTKDNCASFLAATILDRDVKALAVGKIAVGIIDKAFDDRIYNDDVYTMIESEVYFEPYLHAMKVLQDPSFPEDLAMQKYIVKVDPVPRHPAYLTEEKEFVVKETKKTLEDEEKEKRLAQRKELLKEYRRNRLGNEIDESITELNNESVQIEVEENVPILKFIVLRNETWPSREEMNFNESQYEAYRLALTHEFAVIQGPPGTGKTYLGINIAKTLLRNLKADGNCLMLVICYTNHALDQFLESILKITSSVTRIGGQSRNKAMEEINLTNLRRRLKHHPAQAFCNEQRYALKDSISIFRKTLVLLDVLNNGVISYNSIKDDVREIRALGEYYDGKIDMSKIDPLNYWLFETRSEYVSDFNECLLEYGTVEKRDNDDTDEYLLRVRTEMVLDNLNIWEEDDTQPDTPAQLTASFSLDDAKSKLKKIVLKYNTCENYDVRYSLFQEIQDLNSKIYLFNDMLTHRNREVRFHVTHRTNFAAISPQNRWCLYFTWVKNKLNAVKAELDHLQTTVSNQVTAYEEARMMMDVQLLEDTKVIGMTTSGAARMRKLLQTISPTIVIVEEAAEVLEQHIITSLTKSCQHLILIGDHQQLRPSASHMRLAKKFNLEVSLFERMITNGIHSRRLNVQHRMRPEIAQLISPHIYSDLENHPSVENFGNIRGMTNNVFFLTHNYREEEITENMSRSNHKEADLVLGLANYIVQQGYNAEDVTILAAYSGQMFYMKKERDTYSYLSGVKVTVVDNYQGEESKIILLSLVRNNDDNKIGFLGTENRICVALSRAREGFYIFGNINMLKQNSPLWQKIATTLEKNNSLGSSLKVQCQNHPEQITEISTPEEFSKVPEGGCLLTCNFQYHCGHVCQLFCHGYDREHITTKCAMKCERILCDLQHVCPLKCRDTCEPCKVLLPKILPCGHEMIVYCHREPEDPANKCSAMIDVTLPNCGHATQKACFINIKDVRCVERCVYRLEKCGHVCLRRCHVTNDPDHERYQCGKACARAKKGCQADLVGERGDHQCQKKCSEDCDNCNVQVLKKRSNCKHVERVACCMNIDDTPCKMKCSRTMACGHFCKKKCSEDCGDCAEKVTKAIPNCGHKIKIECSKAPTQDLCTAKCERTLSCGHPCPGVCGKPCDATKCKKLSSREFDSPCGHKVKLPCNILSSFAQGVKPEVLLAHCKAPCGAELECKHLCGSTCAACHHGRLHAPCRQPCNQDNICGHQCQEPCNQLCPPCEKLCEVKCAHSHCRKLCGAPCVPCTEKCDRRCIHGACTRRCGEPCTRAACAERCPRRLACGHACRGLCGEPCPPVCRLCRPEQFPRGFLGEEYEEEDKFILLQDCGHILEIDDMENLMKGDQESIQIRKCPFCRTPIINTNRYKDQVNAMFKNEINPIKERVYGTKDQIINKSKELLAKYKLFFSGHRTTITKYDEFATAFRSYTSIIRIQNLSQKVSLLQLEMMTLYLNIFEMISECCNKYAEMRITELAVEFGQQLKMICQTLVTKENKISTLKISQQQQKDIGNEIKRMNTIVQLAKILDFSNKITKGSELLQCINRAKSTVFSLSVFQEDKAIEALQSLQKLVKASGIVSKLERELIVKAIGLKAGHWYKCPNGHFYVIGECGGANQVSKCADCGAAIGGSSHTLISNNAHAPEMDGSRFAAWSQEYNNMANFNIDL